MRGCACLVLFCHHLLAAGGPVVIETSPLISVFHMTSYVHREGGQARVFTMYPRRWLPLNSGAKSFMLQGRHERFVGNSAFHTSLRGAPLLVGDTAEVVSPSASSQVQSLMPHNYILSCTVYTVVHQSIPVDYRCFYLTSGASTAVGPYLVHRNRRRLLSTLREEFVEKKYQVFEVIGLLLILSQVNLSSPVERV